MHTLSTSYGSFNTLIGQFHQWELIRNQHIVSLSLHESNKFIQNDLPAPSIKRDGVGQKPTYILPKSEHRSRY